MHNLDEKNILTGWDSNKTSDQSFEPQPDRMSGHQAVFNTWTIHDNKSRPNIVHNLFTSRPKCIPGSTDPGITIVNPTKISVMYGYIHWQMTTEISVMYGSEGVKLASCIYYTAWIKVYNYLLRIYRLWQSHKLNSWNILHHVSLYVTVLFIYSKVSPPGTLSIKAGQSNPRWYCVRAQKKNSRNMSK